MLRLKALQVENFGPFKGRQKIAFPPDGVIIVYGENMRGKTSLLNAIRFALFGKVIGRGTKRTSLHEIGNWEQASIGKFGFKVELEFSFDGQIYRLTRVCSALDGNPAGDDDYRVEHFLERGGVVLGPDQAEAELKRILPEQISRFFLFDGELLQEYEDLLSSESDMGRRISEAIERILGVPILTSARATALRLKERSEKHEATAAQSDQKTREFGNQLADIHAQRDILNTDLKKLTDDLNSLWTRKAVLEESLKRKERYATLMEKRDGLQRQIRDLVDRQISKQSELEGAMGSAWCTILADRMKATARVLVERQSELDTQIMHWNVLQDLKNNASDICPTCLRQITPEVRTELERVSATAQDSDIGAKKDELYEVRRQLNALEFFIASDQMTVLKVRWEVVDEVAIDIASKKSELSEIKKQLENVDEATLRKDKSDFEQTIREIDVTEHGLRQCQERLADNKINAEKIQKRLDKLGGGRLQDERERRQLYAKIHDLLNEAVSAYRDQLRWRVEADATRHFQALTTEPDYAGLRINDSYGLTIIHRDGSAIPVRSASAEHVVALCLVGALQNNAPLQGPIIIDSPFGRLDRGHTTNIVKALPNMAKQVMLLVYEDELPAGLARTELKGKLKAEWKLDRRSARHTELVRRKD